MLTNNRNHNFCNSHNFCNYHNLKINNKYSINKFNKFKIIIIIITIINFFPHIEASSSFTPSPRYATSSILIGTRLYFFGGWAKDSDSIENCQSDVFYLDISNSFNIDDNNQNIPWNDLTSTAEIPERICWHNSIKETNNNTIYLFGGITQNIKSKELTYDTLLYKFDITSQKWSKPSLTGISPGRRINLEIVQNNKNDSENTYIFGGLTTNKLMWFNDMNILETLKLTWLLVETSGIDIPPPQADFTATLLSNGIILYIGGRKAVNGYGDKITFKKMDQIWTYDTTKGYWELIIATGTIPGVRVGHSAVLALDGRIIIYGGKNDEILLTPAIPDLAVLDTSVSPFKWTIPKIKNIPPPVLAHHTATLIESIIIIAFGNITRNTTLPSGPSSNLYLLDISDYNWITKFNSFNSLTPTETYQSSTTTPTTSSYSSTESELPTFLSTNTALLIGSLIGGITSIVVLLIIALLLFRRWRKFKKLYGDKLPFSDPVTPPQPIALSIT
ncbi:hypothetical protein Glove_209g23 [Diversispora epigaea]|uniref:Galactose oxidase n=1 Tax=Diversispora epigaea TaxID=1348612 RepID=A0A397ILR6_9GLOM|nr:hypothetical protein Glove_209g23 [Diversispora epigaea]